MSQTPLFPESYTPWLLQRLPGTLTETLATCDRCAMVKPKGLTRDPGPFDPNLKCCTYFPFVPNFGIGAMLSDSSQTVRLRLATAARTGLLLPLGLFASPEREQLAKKLGQENFGRRPELLCPFFDSAVSACSAWKHRPGVCASYFCSSDRGAAGLELWADVEAYLNHFEWTLANETFLRMGFTGDEVEMCEAAMLTDGPGEERDFLVRRAWAEWFDRQAEFFEKCRAHALAVSGEELNELLGDDCLGLEESIRQRL